MTVVLKQKYVICTIETNDPLTFKTTHYTLADRELESNRHIEHLIKEVDSIVAATVTMLKQGMVTDSRQFWVRYTYDYDDKADRRNWGKDRVCLFNPLYAIADINGDESLIHVDFAKKKRV